MASPLQPLAVFLVVCQLGCPPVREELDPYQGEPTQDLTVGELLDGVFVPFVSGGEAQWVWGPQGGTMIMPVVSVKSSCSSRPPSGARSSR